jgi:hypothetical protein
MTQEPDRMGARTIGIRCGVVVAIVAIVSVGAMVVLGRPPSRWREPVLLMGRSQVHALLGLPDADFSPKGWDGWDRPVIVGAWILKVHYDGEGRVIAVQNSFEWGLGHLQWRRDLPERVQRLSASPRPCAPQVLEPAIPGRCGRS